MSSEAYKSQSTEIVKTRFQKAMEAVTHSTRNAMAIILACATPACAANMKATAGPQSAYDAQSAMQVRPDVQAQPESSDKIVKDKVNQTIRMSQR